MPAWRHVFNNNGSQQLHAVIGGIQVRLSKEGNWWTAYLDDNPVADCHTVSEAKSAAIDNCLEILLEAATDPRVVTTEGGQP